MRCNRNNSPRIGGLLLLLLLLLVVPPSRGHGISWTSSGARPATTSTTPAAATAAAAAAASGDIDSGISHRILQPAQPISRRQQLHETQQQQQQQRRGLQESGPPRLRMGPFTVAMSPVLATLTSTEVDTIRDTVEGLLQTYFQTDHQWPDRETTSVTYVGLREQVLVNHVRTDDGEGVEVTMNGLVYFDEGSVNVPTEANILVMIREEALTPDVLREALSVSFPSLEVAEVLMQADDPTTTTPPTPAPSTTRPPAVLGGIVEDEDGAAVDDGGSSSSNDVGGLVGGIVAGMVVLMAAVVLWVHHRRRSIAAGRGKQHAAAPEVEAGEDVVVVRSGDEESAVDRDDWGWKPRPWHPPGSSSAVAHVGSAGAVVPAAAVASSAAAAATSVVGTSPTASSSSASATSSSQGGNNNNHNHPISSSSGSSQMSNLSPDKTASTAESEGDNRNTITADETSPQQRKAVHVPPSAGTATQTEAAATATATIKAGTASAISYWTSFFQRTLPNININNNNISARHIPPVGAVLDETHSVASSDFLRNLDDDDEDFDAGTDGEGTLSDFDDVVSIQPHIVSISPLESFEQHRARGDFVVKKDMLESSIVKTHPNGHQEQQRTLSARNQTTTVPLRTSHAASAAKNLNGLTFANADGNELAFGSKPSSQSMSPSPFTSPDGRRGGPKATGKRPAGDDHGGSDSEDDERRRPRPMMPNPYFHRRPYTVDDILTLGTVDRSSSCALEPTDTSAATLARGRGRPAPTQQRQQQQQRPHVQQGPVNGGKSQNMLPKLPRAWWPSRSSSAGRRKASNPINTFLDGSLNQSGEDNDTFDGGLDDAWDSEMGSLGPSSVDDGMTLLFQMNEDGQSVMNHSLRNESQKRQVLRSSPPPLDGRSISSPHGSGGGKGAWPSEFWADGGGSDGSVASEESDLLKLDSAVPLA